MDITPEIVKTVNFVKKNYSIVPAVYTIVSNAAGFGFDAVREQLSRLEIRELNFEQKKNLLLPA